MSGSRRGERGNTSYRSAALESINSRDCRAPFLSPNSKSFGFLPVPSGRRFDVGGWQPREGYSSSNSASKAGCFSRGQRWYSAVLYPEIVQCSVISRDGRVQCYIQRWYSAVLYPEMVQCSVISRNGTVQCHIQRWYSAVSYPEMAKIHTSIHTSFTVEVQILMLKKRYVLTQCSL